MENNVDHGFLQFFIPQNFSRLFDFPRTPAAHLRTLHCTQVELLTISSNVPQISKQAISWPGYSLGPTLMAETHRSVTRRCAMCLPDCIHITGCVLHMRCEGEAEQGNCSAKHTISVPLFFILRCIFALKPSK